MKIGYARVSTEDQKLDLQISALKMAGCQKIYRDFGVSGMLTLRPGLSAMMKSLTPGQTVVVWRLDRLGRSLSGLIKLIDDISRKGGEFQSLTEAINTGSSSGKLVFHMMAALAEFERSLISERTKTGLQAAQRKGVRLGRPSSLKGEQIYAAIHDLEHETVEEVSIKYGVSVRTMKRYYEKHGG